jgi:RHS repeat-associated protein
LQEGSREALYQIMVARYYSSSLARFMAVDPLAGHLDRPQTLNRYTYTGNNPIAYVDPDGQDLSLASDLQEYEVGYFIVELSELYSQPDGFKIINALEAAPHSIAIGTTTLDPRGGVTGTTGMSPEGVIGINIDLALAGLAEYKGGDTKAQNLMEELVHALQLVQTGQVSEGREVEQSKQSIVPVTPTEGTMNDVGEIVSTSNGGVCVEPPPASPSQSQPRDPREIREMQKALLENQGIKNGGR